jgi:toxin ParE1/3/4
MRHFRLTPKAQTDLQNIARYTLHQWGRNQRNKYIQALKLRIEWLTKNPRAGKNRTEIFEDVYSFPEGEHLIFYRIFPDHIDIVGVPHVQMDVPAHFGVQ